MMPNNSDSRERRRHPRYILNNGAFAVLIAGKRHRLGVIIDISLNGLACRYLADDTELEETETLELFAPQKSFHSDPIPCKTKSDFVIPAERSFSLIPMMRQSFQFEPRTTAHRAQIEKFIQLYTAEK